MYFFTLFATKRLQHNVPPDLRNPSGLRLRPRGSLRGGDLYTYKGPDRACMELLRDEVAEYIDARYLSAPEACWRLFQFPLHARSHAIERLPVHLEWEQSILFEEGEERTAAERAALKQTKLTAWFELNAKEARDRGTGSDELSAELPANSPKHIPASSLLYRDVPNHYVWHAQSCHLTARLDDVLVTI